MSEKSTIYHIGISGGKDSTALLLWMVYESGIPREQLHATFCDTQNEAKETYDHIDMLSTRVFPIERIETLGFNEIVRRHKMFPNKHRRYCTRDLKLTPTKHYLDKLTEQYEVIATSGVRRDESYDRSKLPEWGDPMESYFGLREWRPLIDWKIEDVLTLHAKHKIPLNALYSAGAQRVGCFPCIFSSKREIRAMAYYFPERVNAIREMESQMINERGDQTFFQANKIPTRFRTGRYKAEDGRIVKVCRIDDVVSWSMTSKRAQGAHPDYNGLFDQQIQDLPPRLCISQSMACE